MAVGVPDDEVVLVKPGAWSFGCRTSLLRARDTHEDNRVTFVELFFDLVFVFAVTQLSHGLLEHLTPQGLLQMMVLLMAVWWGWIDTSWVTNWLDPQRTAVRVMLFLLMLCGLMMSTAIPHAFDERGLVFACAYAAMQVGRTVFMLWALRHHHDVNYRNFQRIAVWFSVSAAFWIAGGLASGETRMLLWIVGMSIETLSPSLGFYVPGLGRSTTADWDVAGGHLAERCGLFVIIALGESILVTGATFAGIEWNAPTVAAFLAAFVGSLAMWWIYFNVGAERGSRRIERSDDPGRLARLAYTYFHIVIVAGIIFCAVSDELILTHPLGHTEPSVVATILGGPAVYLVGNILFKQAIVGRIPLSHLIGLALLAGLWPAASYLDLPPFALGAAASAALVVVALWETVSLSGWRWARKEPAG